MPFLVIKFSGEQLIIENSLSFIKKASGARLVFDNLQKKSIGSIFRFIFIFSTYFNLICLT